MKKAFLGIARVLIILLIGGCLGTPKRTTGEFVEFSEMVAHPQRYHGSEICTAGVYASGFETSALGASAYEVDGAVYLSEPAVWIEGSTSVPPVSVSRPEVRHRASSAT